MDQTAKKVLKPGYATDLNGISREFRKSADSLTLVFVLALFFIFLVLAAQFESFVDPFVILLSVPLSMAGALLALQWSGGTLNVFSQIGLITLVGLITKHGILIVEFANQLREQGLDTMAAIRKSASQRLRPILMTTGAMVLGALPLALATGAGAESRQPDRMGHRGWHEPGHAADDLCRAHDVFAAGAPACAGGEEGGDRTSGCACDQSACGRVPVAPVAGAAVGPAVTPAVRAWQASVVAASNPSRFDLQMPTGRLR